MKVHFVHGWAGHSSIWNKLAPLIPGSHFFFDRGYFGEAFPLPQETPDVLILHSMAPHFLNAGFTHAVRKIVYINGFDHFCGIDDAYHRMASKNLQRMMRQFEMDPMQTVRNFYSSGQADFGFEFLETDSFQSGKLLADLKTLTENASTLSVLGGADVLCFVDSEEVIAPASSRRELEKRAERVIFTQTGSHFLPVTQPEFLAGKILAWLTHQPF